MELNTSEAQFVHKLLEEKSLKEYFDCQTRGVNDNSFTEESPKASWKFIQDYTREYGDLPTLRTVQEQVPTFTPGPTPEQLAYYRDKLIRQMNRLKVANFATDLAQKVQDDDPSIIDFIGRTYQALIGSERISDFGRFREMMDRIIEYSQRCIAGEEPMGVPTGIKELDDHFLGFRPGDYGVISGRTGEGKTTLALFMAFSAFMQGYKVSYITLEMPREQIFEKLDALATGISINKIKRLKLTEEELAKYKERAEQLKVGDSDILIHDRTGSCSIITVEAILNQDLPDILFVDSIYLMKTNGSKSQWEGIKETSNRLKQLAMKYRKPIIVLSQVNRDGADTIRGGELPSIAHLSYSDALGQDADHVFVLTSNDKTRFYHAKRLSTMKLRGAEEKDMMVKWEPTTNYFEYLDEYKNVKAPSKEVQDVLESQEAHKPVFNDQSKRD
jgi:replicative DNA helicase